MDRRRTDPERYLKPRVSVIIPTYNEAKNLPLILPYIPRNVVDEVIIVDGRSTDHTIEVARQLMPDARVEIETSPGKGAAMQCGYQKSTGDILVVLDADGSNDPREIPRFVDALMHGADFVKGSRFAPMGGTTDMPRLRKFGNWGFVVLTNLLFSKKFSDLAYGYHAFWRHCLDYLEFENVNGFEIDASIYLQAMRKKLKVVEVPSFEGIRFYGTGKLRTFPDGWRVLKTIMREWAAGIRQPAPDPQVGFRSYGINPAPQETILVPRTGADAAIEAEDFQQDTFTISEIVQLHFHADGEVELEKILPRALVMAMEELGASSGGLLLFDSSLQVKQSYRSFGRNIEKFDVGEIADTMEKGVIRWVIDNRQPAVLESTANDTRWHNRTWEEEQGTSRTALVVPFFEEEDICAILTLTRPEERPFGQADLDHLMDLQVKV